MIEKIQLTCGLFLGLSFLFIVVTVEQDINDAIRAIVLAILFGSALVIVILALVRIWT